MNAHARLLSLLASSLLLSSAMALGQTVTGGITGSITDSSGAVLPGAQVIAHNIDTGVDTPVTTNQDGFYRINFLPIGHYQVFVNANGFNQQTVPPFTLEVLQTPTFNIKMSVGAASTNVDVSAAAPILNTENPTLGTTFTANVIRNFPLNGLDFSALTLYLPGSVDTAGTSGTTSFERSTNYVDTPNMNGNRAQANNYTLDGIDMNESFNNLIAYSPAPEALEEVKVLTANSPADYGNVNGGGVVSVLKSGTNKFHGSAYGFTQNQNYNANSWQNNDNIPKTPKSTFSQNQFGGTLGGPILREKLFFFVDYLGSRYHKGGTTTASVLTPAMRAGDFSVLLDPAVMCPGYTGAAPCPGLIQLYDTQNNFAPYVNNQIPIVNPVAKFLIANTALYPLPNAKPTSGTPAGNNLQGSYRNFHANDQGDIKIEYDPRPRDKVTGFYSMSTGYDGSTSILAITFPGVALYPTKITGANWVHTFSPNIVNSARVGFTRVVWSTGLPGDPSGQFGLTGNSKVGIPFGKQSYVGFSNQGLGSGFSNVGTPAQGGGFIDNTYSYIDNLTWQKGLHTLSMGVQAIRYQTNYPTSNNYGYLGSLNYSGVFTSNVLPTVTQNGQGYSAADFLLDRVAQAAVTSSAVNVGQRQWRTAEFFSDDWHVLPNLTINLGLRYEIDQPWIEQNNKTGNVDLTTGQTIYADHVPVGAPANSGVCKNRGCYQYNYRQLMPRLGFAYQASDRFVLRGGYGATSFYEGNSANQRLTSITPFIQAVNIPTNKPAYTAATATTPAVLNPGTPRTVEDGFAYTDPTDLSLSGSYNVYPQNIQPAYVQEWSLTGEYALTRSLSLQVGYIGEQGQHIEDYGNVNQPHVLSDPTSTPYYSNPNFGEGSLLITESRAAMNFQAMESTLRQRVSRGLEFTLNYTYGKALTNSLGNYGLNVNGFSGAFQNYYDGHADWGPAGYDIRHNVSATGVYALPVGRGQEYFSHTSRVVDEAIGGWKLSTAIVSYTGFPETVTGPGNNSNNEGGNSRANQYRKLKIVHQSLNAWFGTDPSATPCTTPNVDNGVCAFGAAGANSFGSSSNGAVRGPGYFNADLSAFKDFKVVESQTIGFRFDAFNAFNIVSYGNPDVGVTDSTFGQILSQQAIRSTERRLQFSARYIF